jgi:hypothetical protein
MKPFSNFLIVGVILAYSPAVFAAEWFKVTENRVKDQFFIDKSSIQRRGDSVWYWEFREFQQPNNAFLEETVNQPIHGLVMNWSVDCVSKTQRLRQATAYDKSRKVIQRFSYGDNGSLAQPRSGSSASAVLEYVCQQAASPRSGN